MLFGLGRLGRWRSEMPERCRGKSNMIALVISLFCSSCLIAQVQPGRDSTMFSESELYQAFAKLLPAAEARRLAREFSWNDILEASEKDHASGLSADSSAITTLPRPNPKEVAAAYSDDILLALSFVSPETEQKVERYRRSRAHGSISSTEEASWSAARERFKKMLEAVRSSRGGATDGSSP